MTQQAMLLGSSVVGSALEALARQHARQHGLTFVRIERSRDLFAPCDVAVFAHPSGTELRRTEADLRGAV